MKNSKNQLKNPKATKKIDLSDRAAIELGLCRKEDFRTIAEKIGRHPSTIAREVKANRSFTNGSYPFSNDCHEAKYCTKLHVCGDESCDMYCRMCIKNCHEYCSQYRSVSCHEYQEPPYVCNACSNRKYCTNDRYFYSAKYAENYAKRRASAAHSGRHMSDEEFRVMDEIVQKNIRKGRPLTNICMENAEKIPVSSRHLYRLIDQGVMSTRNIDLRRKAGYKHRRKKKDSLPRSEQKCRMGRTYADFLAYMEGKSDAGVVEMDTVRGARGKGSVLLTMLFRRNAVMLIFIMPDGTQESVKRWFDFLEETLGLDAFRRLFGIILTDNGAEFKGADNLELTPEGLIRTSIFYCDPMSSGQKGRLEKNHEYIRYVLPKGSNFNGYTQKDMTVLVNHINSTARKSLDFQAPYDLISCSDNDMNLLMNILGLKRIPEEKVNLTPELLKPDKMKKRLQIEAEQTADAESRPDAER